MPDAIYVLNGTSGVRSYMRANGIDRNLFPRLASSVAIPQIHFTNENGQSPASFTRRINQSQAESLASLLGTDTATLVTNAVLIQLP